MPDLSDIMAAILPPDQKAKRAADAIHKLPWCSKDEDNNCPVEESIEKAVEIIQSLDLTVGTPVSKKATLGTIIYDHAAACCHWAEPYDQNAMQAVAEAVRKAKVRLGAPSRPVVDKPELFYERRSEKFDHLTADGVWQGVRYDSAVRLLVAAGMSDRRDQNGGLSEVETELIETMLHCPIDYAGPLAGWKTGKQTISGWQVLVTRSYQLIEPTPGDFPIIYTILGGMLGKRQLKYFLSELKIAYEALRDDVNRPGHMLVFCGKQNAFKSFTQHHIVTPILGGRSADCSRALTNRTDFNSELAGAEHLFLDDQKPYGSWLSRHDFAENLKPYVVGKIMSIHGKGKEAINLPVRQRVTMSLNDDDTALRSMPDIATSFADKVSMFHCRPVQPPMPNNTNEERLALEAAVRAELPAFVHFLVNWKIPAELADVRFGVKAYHRPWLVQQVEAMSDETRLETIIEAAHLVEPEQPWVGTAEELRAELVRNLQLGREAEKLLNWTNATGTLLGRLAKRHPEQYQNPRRWIGGKQHRFWVITSVTPSHRAGHLPSSNSKN